MRVYLYFVVSLTLVLGGCVRDPSAPQVDDLQNVTERKMDELLPSQDDPWLQERLTMVDSQIRRRGIQDERILKVMEQIPRHLFVPKNLQSQAYNDYPLPIGHEQTISQPYIVALMTELVRPIAGDRALEIGTGCGYQAAVLSDLVQEVYSIEIIEPLSKKASTRLSQLGKKNVEIRFGDGYQGWPEHAPFQIIVVTAAPDHVPQPLLDQLAPNGRMVIPVGRHSQELQLIEKSLDGSLRRSKITPVAFVPMTGIAEKK
jgi:protein-L-isoaspartate(D-aspartate) O-methyltransferase